MLLDLRTYFYMIVGMSARGWVDQNNDGYNEGPRRSRLKKVAPALGSRAASKMAAPAPQHCLWAWWCTCDYDGVPVILMVYLRVWWCTCEHDDVPVSLMVYLWAWSCICEHDSVSVSLMVYLWAWWCTYEHDDSSGAGSSSCRAAASCASHIWSSLDSKMHFISPPGKMIKWT